MRIGELEILDRAVQSDRFCVVEHSSRVVCGCCVKRHQKHDSHRGCHCSRPWVALKCTDRHEYSPVRGWHKMAASRLCARFRLAQFRSLGLSATTSITYGLR